MGAVRKHMGIVFATIGLLSVLLTGCGSKEISLGEFKEIQKDTYLSSEGIAKKYGPL